MLMRYNNGRVFEASDIRPDDMDVEQLFHNLSQLNRWVGATDEPYTVGQHTLTMATWLMYQHRSNMRSNSPLLFHSPVLNLFMCGILMHDLPEALLNDVPRPFKDHAGLGHAWDAAEDEVAYAFSRHVGIDFATVVPYVRSLDNMALLCEHAHLFTHPVRDPNFFHPSLALLPPMIGDAFLFSDFDTIASMRPREVRSRLCMLWKRAHNTLQRETPTLVNVGPSVSWSAVCLKQKLLLNRHMDCAIMTRPSILPLDDVFLSNESEPGDSEIASHETREVPRMPE